MADEELLEEGKEKQGSEVKTKQAPEPAEEVSSENDNAVEGEEAAEMNAESEEAASEEAAKAGGDESQDGSEEQSVDELAEQQMLSELEELESDDHEDTVKDIQQPDFPTFSQSTTAAQEKNLDLLLDVNLPISIELGRTTMRIKEILALGPGSVVELKKLAGEPVDLLVNNNIVAKGEVVVVDENFGLRIVSLLSREERLRSLEE